MCMTATHQYKMFAHYGYRFVGVIIMTQAVIFGQFKNINDSLPAGKKKREMKDIMGWEILAESDQDMI